MEKEQDFEKSVSCYDVFKTRNLNKIICRPVQIE